MLNIPVLRWGQEYKSLEVDPVNHFLTGESLAGVGQANAGLVRRDMRKAKRARDVLREIPCGQLCDLLSKAADLYLSGTLPIGDGEQSPDDFARQQSATTGLPEHMCKANMQKNHFVLTNMRKMVQALTRGLDLDALARGHGTDERGVTVSFQPQTPALGLVLPSNSPGVHTLWLPVIPFQIGLVLKPGPQEPWTPYRMAAAFFEAGVPREAISIYPGGADVGQAVVASCRRTMLFGGQPTVEMHKGNPNVQVHGPGFSKIVFGDDCVDDWEKHIDLIADSVHLNSGRGCINCSGVWASRHTDQIARALAERLGPIDVGPPDDPEAALAAFTVPGIAQALWKAIEADCKEAGVNDLTSAFGPRLVEMERCAYLRPVVVHCDSPDRAIAGKEYMFPFVTVVRCPQAEMIEKMGPTLVCSAITGDPSFQRGLMDAAHVDRLNLGAVPTVKLDWLQPHEGNLFEYLYRHRAFQIESAA